MSKLLKRIGLGLGTLLGLLILVGLSMYAAGTARMNKAYIIEPVTIIIPEQSAELERGEYLAGVICANCHGADLGGDVVFEQEGIVAINAPNITTGPGGLGGQPADDLALAIRHGIDDDGTPLLVMPAEIFIHWSVEDIGAVIAYLSEAPPVDNAIPEVYVSPVARVLVMAGLFGKPFPAEYIAHDVEFPERPPIEVTEEYGKYMIGAMGCTLCHGENLAGGITPPNDPPVDIPPSANLTPSGELVGWSEEDFLQTLQTGVTPSGREINPEYMPWDMYARLHEEDLRAIWLYLQSLPPAETATE